MAHWANQHHCVRQLVHAYYQRVGLIEREVLCLGFFLEVVLPLKNGDLGVYEALVNMNCPPQRKGDKLMWWQEVHGEVCTNMATWGIKRYLDRYHVVMPWKVCDEVVGLGNLWLWGYILSINNCLSGTPAMTRTIHSHQRATLVSPGGSQSGNQPVKQWWQEQHILGWAFGI